MGDTGFEPVTSTVGIIGAAMRLRSGAGKKEIPNVKVISPYQSVHGGFL